MLNEAKSSQYQCMPRLPTCEIDGAAYHQPYYTVSNRKRYLGFLSVFYLFFIANLLSGWLPEYGPRGGWDYSQKEADRDCAEFRKKARVYHQDQDGRLYFACENKD